MAVKRPEEGSGRQEDTQERTVREARAGEFGGGDQLRRQVIQGLKRFSSTEITGDPLRRRSDCKGR